MVSLNNLPLGLYEKAVSFHLTWEEKLTLAKESGFDFVEINIDGAPERLKRLYSDDEVLHIRHAQERVGLSTPTMALTANRLYPLGSEDSSVRDRGLEIVKRGVVFASQLGIRVIHLAGYDEHGEKCSANTQALFFDAIRECVDFATQYGVTLAIETMDEPFMGSCKKIMGLIKTIDSPFFQCYADIGNLSAAGIDIKSDLALAGRHIVGVHLKDTRPGVYRDVPFGEGTVDFDACLADLKAIGYRGFFTAETWCYDKDEFHKHLKEINLFLRRKMINY